MLNNQKVPVNATLDDRRFSSGCKVAILAVRTTSVDSREWFRTYSSPHSDMERSVVDALCASMALATIFAPVLVGPDYAAEEFSGGGLSFNNPTRELLKEALLLYGSERQLSVILSLGSRRPKELSLEDSGANTAALEGLVRKLTINCEAVERDISYQLYDVGAYIRLNVDQGLDGIGFYSWLQLGKVSSHTKQYLQTIPIVKLVDMSIIALAEEAGVMTLGQLARTTKIKRQAKAPPAVSPYFVVRMDIWEITETELLTTRKEGLNIFVITGMGGCGKTQTTAYFVQRYQSRFHHIFFIDASSQSTIKSDLRSAIRSIDGHQQDTDEDALSFLSSQPDSLVQVTMAKDTILLRYHPLVHAWANEKTAPEVVSLHFRMAITVLSTSLKSIPPAHLQYLLPHIVSIVERASLKEFHLTDLTILGWFMGGNSMTKPSVELFKDSARRLKEEAYHFLQAPPLSTALLP